MIALTSACPHNRLLYGRTNHPWPTHRPANGNLGHRQQHHHHHLASSRCAVPIAFSIHKSHVEVRYFKLRLKTTREKPCLHISPSHLLVNLPPSRKKEIPGYAPGRRGRHLTSWCTQPSCTHSARRRDQIAVRPVHGAPWRALAIYSWCRFRTCRTGGE